MPKLQQAEMRKIISDGWKNGVDGDNIGPLRVPRFGKEYEVPIIKGFGKEYEVPIIKGFDQDTLSKGVGMYEKAALPGELGNFAIAGHRVTDGEPFRDFLKLKKGDEVVVETRTAVFTYELRNHGDSVTLAFTVGWPLQQVPEPDMRGEPPRASVLSMLTCSELFHTRNRNVVFGDLVKIVDNADHERGIPLPSA